MNTNPRQPAEIVRMTCEVCGAVMNPHAEKLTYPSSPSNVEHNMALGGVIEEIHQCPACGRVQSRLVV